MNRLTPLRRLTATGLALIASIALSSVMAAPAHADGRSALTAG